MLKHYFKIIFRSIWKDKGYSLINILGLSVAIACCFLLLFWIKFEMSFEDCYPKTNRIYKVIKTETREEGLYRNDYIEPVICEKLKARFPEIEAATYTSHQKLAFSYGQNESLMADYVITTTDYLKMFSYVYIEGDPASVVKTKSCIISKEAADKFFGKESPIGKTLVYGNNFLSIKIGAIVELPKNTQIRFDILDPFGTDSGGQHFFMLKENVSLSLQTQEHIKDILLEAENINNKLEIQPLYAVHLHSPKEIAINTDHETYGNYKQIYLFSAVVLLVLIIAIINYINTSVARAMGRMKEVGIRKVTGSSAKQLILRFLLESFTITLVSALLAIVITLYFFPYFSEIMGNKVLLSFDIQTILIVFSVCIVVSILSGGYSAFYLTRLTPISILKGGYPTGSKGRLRKILIGFQFFISVFILTCTFIMYKQLNEIFNADTGVDRDNIIILNTGLWYDAESYIKVIKNESPDIIDASIAMSAPYNASYGYSGISWEGCAEEIKNIEFAEICCDSHYANTFGIKIIDGGFIPPQLSWWQYADDKSYNIVINESFKKIMGEENPIGITVNYGWERTGKIIGIVKDFNFKPLRENISPLIISFNPEVCDNLYIKTSGKNKQITLDYILRKYKEMKPDYAKRPIIYYTMEDEYNKMYEVELRTLALFSVFSVISFILSLMGIISMISLMVEKRTKEIAIRKINGANVWNIIKLFAKEILKIAIIASFIAIAACYIVMSQWLQTYVYRTTLNWWIFVCIPLALLLIIFAVVAIEIFFTTRQNPVKSLRIE